MATWENEMSIEITDELLEEFELPSYDKWLEGIWEDGDWWDWILDEFVEDCKRDGMLIDHGGRGNSRLTPIISFDIYRRQCTSDGRVKVIDESFYIKFKDQLLSVSPVLAQLVLEQWVYIQWGSSNHGWLEVSVELDSWINNATDQDVFTKGLLAGTSVAELYELEKDKWDNFETCIKNIIEERHNELLEKLEAAYEYDISEERYEEWIREEIAMMKSLSPTSS